MSKTRRMVDAFSFWIIVIGVISLIVEKGIHHFYGDILVTHVFDYVIFCLYVFDLTFAYIKAESKWQFFNTYCVHLFVLGLFTFFFVSSKTDLVVFSEQFQGPNLSSKIIVIMTVFNALRAATRIKQMNQFVANFANNPAQTIVLSFASIILMGTIFLMMPFATHAQGGISVLDALFTATSATCVTGLTVVDTPQTYTIFGQIITMLMMQAGGLGIMILSYFTAFIVGRRISLQDKMTLSYMLNEQDVHGIRSAIHRIIGITCIIECVGALLLWWGFGSSLGWGMRNVFFAVFHAVSAFCNAGFSLFSENLMGYQKEPVVLLTIAALIICGGLSFSVMSNVVAHAKSVLRLYVFKREDKIEKLSLNTRIVTRITIALIASGTLLLYALAHGNALFPLDTLSQYLNAFFQAVTLRTAGFNTVDFSHLSVPTYVIMLFFMFIGGASGSTAGGIKVNTIGVIYAYVKSIFSKNTEVVIMKQSLSYKLVTLAFSVVIFALIILFLATLTLTITDSDKTFIQLLFEVVSAFGTVGLSTGITAYLTEAGKTVIICVMFIGRLGPLTMIAALSRSKRTVYLKYPEAQVTIG